MQHNLSSLLLEAKQQLSHVTDVPQLEAEILLAHVLNKSRSYLHTWPNIILEIQLQSLFLELIKKRMQGEPIAYLTGHREFWSLDLVVTPDVLIPRPETELLVELILHEEKTLLQNNEAFKIADLGTGSGAIALAIAHERPGWNVHATDASSAALKIAQLNAKRLSIANIAFYFGKWCDALPQVKFNAIVSNPPYVSEDDPHLMQGDLRFEPKNALISADEGLADIAQIIYQAKEYLIPGGIILIEHGFQQAEKITNIFSKSGYNNIHTYQDLAGLDRVTKAQVVYDGVKLC